MPSIILFIFYPPPQHTFSHTFITFNDLHAYVFIYDIYSFVSVVVFLSALICDINFYMVNIENNSYKNVNVIHERKTADKIEFSSLPSQISLNDTCIRYRMP